MAWGWGGKCDEGPFPVHAAAGSEARADPDQLKLTGIVLVRHERGIHVVKSGRAAISWYLAGLYQHGNLGELGSPRGRGL